MYERSYMHVRSCVVKQRWIGGGGGGGIKISMYVRSYVHMSGVCEAEMYRWGRETDTEKQRQTGT